ncbi:MAG: endolytic transglycosylase MltG [Lachnospiraceae bacterium]|nr:endolytic transglycosylase MltG [Lachnospiraceae bacterium]
MSGSLRKTLRGFVIVFGIIFNICFYCGVIYGVNAVAHRTYDLSYRIFGNVTVSAEGQGRDYRVTIDEGEATMDIAKDLYSKGIIIDRFSFYIRAKLTTNGRRPILPGTYTINSSMTYDEILELFTDISAGGQNNQNNQSTK